MAVSSTAANQRIYNGDTKKIAHVNYLYRNDVLQHQILETNIGQDLPLTFFFPIRPDLFAASQNFIDKIIHVYYKHRILHRKMKQSKRVLRTEAFSRNYASKCMTKQNISTTYVDHCRLCLHAHRHTEQIIFCQENKTCRHNLCLRSQTVPI